MTSSTDTPGKESSMLAGVLARPDIIGSALIGIAFLAAWQWLPGLLGVPRFIIPPASEVWTEFLYMIEREQLLLHTAVTMASVAAGFALGALLGMLIGYALGMSATLEVVLSPYILALQIAPKVAFAPLFVMWFGFTVFPKILVAMLIVFFPVMVNVLGAVRTIDRDQINLARAFNATRGGAVLENRGSRLDAAAVLGAADRRHAGRDRRGGRRAGRRQRRARLSARVRAGSGQYADGFRRHPACSRLSA